MPINLKTQINLEEYQLLEKQSLTEREAPHGTKTIKEIEPIMKPYSQGMDTCDKNPARCQPQREAGGT